MKNYLPKMTLNYDQHWLSRRFSFTRSCLLFIGFVLLFVRQTAEAQVPCPNGQGVAFTITGEDASQNTTTYLPNSDAKIRVSGSIPGNYKVGYSTGSTYTGPTFALAPLYSSLSNGYISTTLPTPTLTTGQPYTIRVFKDDGSCYTEQTFTLPYVNFNTPPIFPDIMVTVTKDNGTNGFHALNSTATITIAVKNEGTGAATGVKFTVGIPAGLTAVAPQVGSPAVGTYNSGTGVWDIGNLAVNQTVSLILTGTVSTRGVKYLSANNTALVETDQDSSPTTSNAGEDDQGAVCITTPFDFCSGDLYTITLPSYTGIKWFKGGVELTAGNATASGVVLNVGGSLGILAEGEYSYSMTVGPNACPSGGCCPIKVEAGVKPNLTAPAPQTICLNGTFGAVTATNSQVSTNNNGSWMYQWYNNNGAANPSTTILTGQTSLTLGTLPTAVGVYNYKVIVYAQNHPNCKDSVNVILTINQLPTPTIASNSPVCTDKTISFTAGGGTGYAWTGPAAYAATGATPTRPNAIVGHSGTYVVTVTNGVGCSATTSIPVVVNPLPVPTIASNSPVCTDKTISFTAGGGTNYAWTGPATFTGTGTNPTRPNSIVAHSGTYNVTVTDANGCSATTSIPVIVNPLPVPTIASNSPVCTDKTISFTAGGGTNYAWTGPATFTGTGTNPTRPNAIVAHSGTYNVTVTDANGCSATTSIPVVVNPLPVPTIASNSPVCTDKTISFTAGGGTNYAWSGPATFTGTGANPTRPNAIVAHSGTYNVTVTSGLGCSATTSIAVIVNPLPVPTIASNSPVCTDNTISFTAGGGTNYAWTGPATFTGTGTNPTRPNSIVAHSGTYNVTVTDANGCSATTSIPVIVNPLPVPTIASNSPVCTNNTISFTAGGGTNYAWSGPATFTGTGSNPTRPNALVTHSGTYNVTVTNANGCTATTSIPVVVNPLPVPTIASNSPVCQEQTINFTAGGGASYSWTGPVSFSSTSATPSRTNALLTYAGTYVVTVTSGDQCSATASVPVIVNPKPVIPIVSQKTFCEQDLAATLSANATALGSHFLQWYGTNSTGGVGSTTATTHNPTTPGTSLYYVSQTVNATGCESNRATVIVLVNPKPAPPTTTPVSVCENSTPVFLSANAGASGFTLLWYGTSATGGTGLTTAPNPATSPVGTSSYYVSKKDDITTCESNRASLLYTVRPTPVPTIASNSPVCEEQTINFTAGGGTAYSWTGPSGFTSTVNTPSRTNALSTYAGTYAVTVTNGQNCSASTSVVVVVNPKPSIPVVTNKVFCEQDLAATLSTNATALGSHFLQWYGINSTGGVGSTTATIHNPTTSGTTLYYVSQTVNATGCESNRATIIVLVNPKPAPPMAADKTYCQGVAASPLTANAGASGFTLLWYGTSSTGGAGSTTAPTPLTNTAGTTTYYVSKKDDVTTCESNRDDAIVIVNPTPGAPTTTPIVACQDATPVSLSAVGAGGNTIVWYNGGSTTTTAPLSVTNTPGLYFVGVSQIIPGTGCESPMASVSVTVNPKPVATVIAVSSLCIGSVSQNNAKLILTRYRNDDEVSYNIGTPYAGTPTSSTYATVPGGGVFASNLPNPTAALGNDYTVRIKNSFGCTIDRLANISKKDCGCPGGYCEPATITKTK